MTTATVNFRKDLDLTMDGLVDRLKSERKDTAGHEVAMGQIGFNLASANKTINIGSDTVPATQQGVLAFGDFLHVPSPFLKRMYGQHPDVTGDMLRALVEGSQDSAINVVMGEGGVVQVSEAGKQSFNPVGLAEIGQRILGGDAPIQRLIQGGEFGFDAHVPFDSKKGVGGDRSKKAVVPEPIKNYSWMTKAPIDSKSKVGDITASGLRFGIDLKHGLTPWVQRWSYRLACTNGMETTDEGLRIDGRGMTIEEVMLDLEAQAQRAFSAVERDIAHFYAMRDQAVDNPERMLVRTARERGIPERSLRRMLDAAPSDVLPDNPTMFDLTNLITNMANSPAMRNDGGRLLLERAGGALVNDSAMRCGHCHQKTGDLR